MDKKGSLDPRDSTGGIATRTKTITVSCPRDFFTDPASGDGNAAVQKAYAMIESDLRNHLGSGWNLAWQNADAGSGLTVLIDGSPPTTDEETNLTEMVTSIVRDVRDRGEY